MYSEITYELAVHFVGQEFKAFKRLESPGLIQIMEVFRSPDLDAFYVRFKDADRSSTTALKYVGNDVFYVHGGSRNENLLEIMPGSYAGDIAEAFNSICARYDARLRQLEHSLTPKVAARPEGEWDVF